MYCFLIRFDLLQYVKALSAYTNILNISDFFCIKPSKNNWVEKGCTLLVADYISGSTWTEKRIFQIARKKARVPTPAALTILEIKI